jgi:hypothetical protein
MNMPDSNIQRQGLPENSQTIYALVGLALFALSFLASFIVSNWSTVNTLFYEASLAKYETMAGARGPTTFLITHSDFPALQRMAGAHTGILSVEQDEGSTVAKMVFRSAQSELVQKVRSLPSVTGMINRHSPLICH